VTKRRGSTIEVESLEQFDDLVGRGATRMRGWLIQGVDLRERTEQLLSLHPAGAVLLGSDVSPEAGVHLRTRGALLFPSIPEVPFDPYRTGLYTPDELYDGIRRHRYRDTPDARIYAWSRHRDGDITYPLARALHDHSIDLALAAELDGRGRTVGVMGAHDVGRDAPVYREAVRLGRALSEAGAYVATGGGPGAMEAANLGAYLRGHQDAAVEEALEVLGRVPGFRPSITEWARAAFTVREAFPGSAPSLGIPTWFYGHEPPNPFASAVAKYFQNSLREDTLLRHCDGGIVFLPGAGGTVQEIFQDGCENYYADEATVAPMVLFGRRHWTEDVPAWPLLRNLAKGRPMEAAVHLVDSVDEVVALLT
jgi:predicted Rossmann-fold nucleotide-binding protein